VGQKIVKRDFAQFGGVDMKADDINRPDVFSPQGNENILFGPRGEIRRFPIPRYSTPPSSGGIAGLQLYKWKGTSYSEKTEKLLGWTELEELVSIEKDTLEITYSGGGVAEVQVGNNTDREQVLTLWVDDSIVLTLSASTNMSVVGLAIGSVPDFSATTGGTVAKVGGLHRYDRQVIDGSINLKYDSFVKMTKADNVTHNIYPGSTYAEKSHVMGDSVTINGSLYMNDLDGSIIKYDGAYWYKAGFDSSLVQTVVQFVGGSPYLGNGTFTMASRAKYVDHNDKVHYGPFFFKTITLTGGANSTIQYSTQYNGDFPNVLYATATNASSGNTIATTSTVNKFKVGDKVYIGGKLGTGFEERTITGLTGLSITVDGASLSWAIGDEINHRITVENWLSIDTGGGVNDVGPFYRLSEGCCLASSYVGYFLGDQDSLVSREIFTDIRRWNVPGLPKGTKLTKFQGSLVLKDSEKGNIVHFSDQLGFSSLCFKEWALQNG
jgi:hypothetical protein